MYKCISYRVSVPIMAVICHQDTDFTPVTISTAKNVKNLYVFLLPTMCRQWEYFLFSLSIYKNTWKIQLKIASQGANYG